MEFLTYVESYITALGYNNEDALAIMSGDPLPKHTETVNAKTSVGLITPSVKRMLGNSRLRRTDQEA